MRLPTLALAALTLAAAVRAEEPGAPQGLLVLVGGGTIPPAAFARMVERVGREARVGIVTDASEEAAGALEAGRERWAAGGFTRLERLPLAPGPIPDSFRIVYLGGGDQVRLLEGIDRAGAREALVRFHARGGILVGNSAGAAVLCRRSLTGRGSADGLRAGEVETVPGLPVLDAVVDQHFVARKRFGRLLAAVLDSEPRLGIGIDEGTAALVTEGAEWEVVGAGTVTLLDARAARVAPTGAGEPLSAREVIVHILRAGDRWSPRPPR